MILRCSGQLQKTTPRSSGQLPGDDLQKFWTIFQKMLYRRCGPFSRRSRPFSKRRFIEDLDHFQKKTSRRSGQLPESNFQKIWTTSRIKLPKYLDDFQKQNFQMIWTTSKSKISRWSRPYRIRISRWYGPYRIRIFRWFGPYRCKISYFLDIADFLIRRFPCSLDDDFHKNIPKHHITIQHFRINNTFRTCCR